METHVGHQSSRHWRLTNPNRTKTPVTICVLQTTEGSWFQFKTISEQFVWPVWQLAPSYGITPWALVYICMYRYTELEETIVTPMAKLALEHIWVHWFSLASQNE